MTEHEPASLSADRQFGTKLSQGNLLDSTLGVALVTIGAGLVVASTALMYYSWHELGGKAVFYVPVPLAGLLLGKAGVEFLRGGIRSETPPDRTRELAVAWLIIIAAYTTQALGFVFGPTSRWPTPAVVIFGLVTLIAVFAVPVESWRLAPYRHRSLGYLSAFLLALAYIPLWLGAFFLFFL